MNYRLTKPSTTVNLLAPSEYLHIFPTQSRAFGCFGNSEFHYHFAAIFDGRTVCRIRIHGCGVSEALQTIDILLVTIDEDRKEYEAQLPHATQQKP
jgi:hypothetical protein